MIDELENFERAPGTERARTRRRIVDECGALQVPAACTEVADFECGFPTQTLLKRAAPLLDILRGSVRIKRRKADGSRAKNRGVEVERRLGPGGGQQRSRGIEIVELLGLWKNKGNVVALVAPGIQVHRGEENAVGGMKNDARARKVVRNAEARCKVVLVRIEQAVWIAVLSADENLKVAALEGEVGVRVGDVVQRPRVFVAHAHCEGRRAGELEAVLDEAIGRPGAELHLRDARLALFYNRKTQEKARKRGAGAVVCARLCGVAARELVVAAILKEAPHGPNIIAEAAAEFEAVTAALPAERIAALDSRVPSAHRRGGVGIAHPGITLHVKTRRSPGTRPSETDAEDTELRDDIVGVRALRKVAHGQARQRQGGDVHEIRRKNPGPGHAALLGKIVVAGAEAGEINGRKPALRAR